MVLNRVLNGKAKWIAIGALGAIAFGGFCNFICEVIWFARLMPWTPKVSGFGKTIFSTLAAGFVFSLISVGVAAAIIALVLFQTNSKIQVLYQLVMRLELMQLALLGASCVVFSISIALGMYCGSVGTNNSSAYDKCSAYANDIYEELRDIMNYPYEYPEIKIDTKALKEWLYNLGKKALVKDPPSDISSPFNGYLCESVGTPALIFSIFQLLGLIIYVFLCFIEFLRPTTDEAK